MKKNIYAVISGAILLFGAVACAKAPSVEEQAKEASPSAMQAAQKPAAGKKILVAYYSYSGNTKAVAGQIAQALGADLFEINTVEPYPAAYGDLLDKAQQEIKSGTKPALSARVENMAQYDVVFIGSPNWWGTIAPAVSSFVSQYDWQGKAVAGFVTHGGGGMQNCERDLKSQLSGATFLQWAAFPGKSSGADVEDLQAWLNKLAL